MTTLFFIPLIFAIVFADLAGVFSYTDMPFFLVFLLFIAYVITQKSTSKAAFLFSLFFLVWMWLSYIPTGAGKVTERIGEWFYLFFVFGLIQYGYEVYRLRK